MGCIIVESTADEKIDTICMVLWEMVLSILILTYIPSGKGSNMVLGVIVMFFSSVTADTICTTDI